MSKHPVPRRTILAAIAALTLAGALGAMPAGAAVTLPYSKTVTMDYPFPGYYTADAAAGAIANRCVSSGFSDCLPHEGDIYVRRSNFQSIQRLRCLYTTDPSTFQSETSSPTSPNSGHSGRVGFIFDFGVDANINGKYFKLKNASPAGTSGVADFDVFWMETLGNCIAAATTPTSDPLASNYTNPGDERDRVPGWQPTGSACSRDFNGNIKPGCPRYALITMFSGDPGSKFKLIICPTTSSTFNCPE